MSGFDEIRMPANLAAGAVGGPGFSTTVFPLNSGFEKRNQNWAKSRYRWTLTHWMKSDADILAMITFFQRRAGKANGFRFQDLADYQVTAYQQFATGDGAATQFQLNKTYTDALGSYQRIIKKPVTGTLSIKAGSSVITEGVGSSHFTCDYTTGIVTIGTAPALSTAIYWTGQFDVPVRFDTDQLDINFHLLRIGSAEGLDIVELRL
ncbi:MAG TPA: DUF2460 domain-containing protein [Dongiaceae bacterium]|nr:DUF2460 domain-containing protein [Dongiaceae bacterium]